ncbi:MAG: serine protease [SAR324 cluster bacterium]|nr:serine protease [SAR324 cluster bacterium]
MRLYQPLIPFLFLAFFGASTSLAGEEYSKFIVPPLMIGADQSAPIATSLAMIHGQEKEPKPRQIQIIKSADFEPLQKYARTSPEFSLSRSVGWIKVDDKNFCTGFLVGPDLMLTSLHCVSGDPDHIRTSRFKIYFEYLEPKKTGSISSTVKSVVATNKKLDFILLKLHVPIGTEFGWLKLNDQPLEGRSEQVMVIQHPSGRAKELVKKNSHMVRSYPQVIHYTSDTEVGSSGAPVFLLGEKIVIALHHASGFGVNEGIAANKILAFIAPHLKR